MSKKRNTVPIIIPSTIPSTIPSIIPSKIPSKIPNIKIDKDGNTPLIKLCKEKKGAEALKLIQSGTSKPEHANNSGNTALIYACQSELKDVALELIKTGKSNPEQITDNRNTALIIACQSKLEEVALAIIQTGHSNPEQVNTNDNTALITACQYELPNVALEIIKTGKSTPEQIGHDGNTALILACNLNFPNVALEIIKTGKSKPEHIDPDGNTALIIACELKLEEVVLELIKTGKSIPEHIGFEKTTALLFACKNNLPKIAIALINTGKSLPGHADEDDITPLIFACANKMSDVAFKLLETEESTPEHIESDGGTALIYACKAGIQDVAVAIIQTEKSNSDQENSGGETAYNIALSKELKGVINALDIEKNNLLDEPTIDINADGFNTSAYEDKKIIDFLNEKNSNLCFIINNQYFLTNKYELIRQSTHNSNIKYGCIEAGETMYDASNNLIGIDYTDDDNIIYDTEYFNLSSLFGLQIIIKKSEIDKITSNIYSSRFYSAIPSGKKIVAIISNAYIQGQVGVGADHCQTGKATEIYHIIPAKVSCIISTKPSINSKSKSTPKNTITVQYKGEPLKIGIKLTTTIGELKKLLLYKLKPDGTFTTTNTNVKFIYKGKVYTDDLQKISDVAGTESPYDITLQSMVTSINPPPPQINPIPPQITPIPPQITPIPPQITPPPPPTGGKKYKFKNTKKYLNKENNNRKTKRRHFIL
jgi:ankyrin repeat protein